MYLVMSLHIYAQILPSRLQRHIYPTASVYTYNYVELDRVIEVCIFLHYKVAYAQTHLSLYNFTVSLVDKIVVIHYAHGLLCSERWVKSFLVLSLI